MVSILQDSERKCYLDHIHAAVFHGARDVGAAFITCSWVALRLMQSEDFVKRNWRKATEDCEIEFRDGQPEQLSQESKNVVLKLQDAGRKVAPKLLKKSVSVEINRSVAMLCTN